MGKPRTHRRTGTLWEGRYMACLVAGDAYLLQRHRYIELDPLRAAMVADPRDYPWFSHRHNAFGEHDPVVRPHAVYSTFAAEPEGQRRHYRAFVMDEVTSEETDAIRAHLQRQHLYGPDRFRRAIEARLGRSVAPARSGDPVSHLRPLKLLPAKKEYSDPGFHSTSTVPTDSAAPSNRSSVEA